MSDQKVLIFGSFSEDESRLFQGQSTRNELPPENAILQFGSLDFNSVRSSEGFCAETKQIATSKRSKDTEASKPVGKDSTFKDAKAAITTDLQNSVEAELSGNTNGCLPLNDGVLKKENDTFGLDLMHISKPGTLPEILITTTVNDNEVERSNGINISVDASSPIGGNQKTSSEQIPLVKSLVPRGLTNLGNLCFLNATLQALLSCSLFVQLLRDIRTRDISKTRYPTLHAFVEFISDFDITHDFSSKKNEEGILEIGKPFSPIMFDVVLKKFTPDVPSSLSGRPRQEDAQEFLSFIMDQMHDELLKLGGHLSSSNGGSLPLILSAEDDGWETVGPKNKSAVTRTQSFMPSELSAIFGGQLRSVVKARGNKASATVQPFLLLHLDIFPEAVHSIEDAFRLFSTPETVEGYRAAAGKAGIVNASKSVKIQTLSKVMILHLMRFSYGSKGSTKLHKPVRFPLELLLGRELLVTPTSKGQKYELVATITHHGWEPSKGHYTADARDSDGRWLRYDDSTVKAVGENAVLHDLAYLLFYKQL